MARGTKTITIKARTSFNEIQIGDVATVELTPRVQGWLNAGLVEEVNDGADQARPSRPEPSDDERIPKGADGGKPSGRQQGQGFGSSAFGSPAGVDKG